MFKIKPIFEGPIAAGVGGLIGGSLLGGGGESSSSDPQFTPNPQAIEALNQLFPDGAQLPVAPGVEFDPSFINQGIEFAQQNAEKGFGIAEGLFGEGLDFAIDKFGDAANFQNPFFNNALGFGQLSQGTLGGNFDPRSQSNAFLFDPNDKEFQFLFDRGVDAIDSAASAKGTLFSGGRAKDLTQFGQGLASTFADEALRRRQAVSQQNFGQLAQLAGFEQAAANNLTNISTGLGSLGEANRRGLGGLGSSVFSGLGSAGLGALTTAAGLQNQTALANAQAELAAQNAALSAFTGLSTNGTFSQPQQEPDRVGQLIGIGGSILAGNPGLLGL